MYQFLPLGFINTGNEVVTFVCFCLLSYSLRWTCSGCRFWQKAGRLLWTASWGRGNTCSAFILTVFWMVRQPSWKLSRVWEAWRALRYSSRFTKVVMRVVAKTKLFRLWTLKGNPGISFPLFFPIIVFHCGGGRTVGDLVRKWIIKAPSFPCVTPACPPGELLPSGPTSWTIPLQACGLTGCLVCVFVFCKD